MTESVQVQRRGEGVVWLVIDRPQAANALSKDVVAGLGAALRALADDVLLRAVVITGSGDKVFCAGADLKERRGMTLDETRACLVDLNALMNDVAAFPRPVVAAMNGGAFGGGLELALACDLRLVVQGAQMGLPEVRLGIIPGAGGTQRLARLCGVGVAKELVLTGRRIDADRALALGLVTAVVPQADLVEAVDRLVAELGEAGPLALAQAKRAIDEGAGRPLAEGLLIEKAAYEVVLASADRNEGLASFAEKRKPKYQGK